MVSLTATSPGGTDALTRTNYVTVTAAVGDSLYRLTSVAYLDTQAYT